MTTHTVTLHIETQHSPATIHDLTHDWLTTQFGPQSTIHNITQGDLIDPDRIYQLLTTGIRSQIAIRRDPTITGIKRRDWLDGYTGALAAVLAQHEHRTATEILDELKTEILTHDGAAQ